MKIAIPMWRTMIFKSAVILIEIGASASVSSGLIITNLTPNIKNKTCQETLIFSHFRNSDAQRYA